MHILPSRGRPEILQRYFDKGNPAEPGVVVLDDDQFDMYRGVRVPSHWDVLYVTPMQGFVKKVNLGFEKYPNEPWYTLEGDDCIGRPAGWDTILGGTAALGYITYGDDLFGGRVTHPYICGDFCRDLGWVAHPNFKHLYVDVIWEKLGMALGVLEFYPGVITEAHHFGNGKLPRDQTSRERMQEKDHAAWDTFNQSGAFQGLLKKLRYRLESYAR